MKTPTLALAAVFASTPFAFAGTAEPSTPFVTSPPAAPQDEWSFEFAPYLWVAFVDGETNLPWNGPGLAATSQKLDSEITGAFAFEAKARYRSFGMFADFNWLQLDTSTTHPGRLYSGADLQMDYIYATAGFSYTLPLEGALHVDLQAGARLWSIASDFTLKPGILAGYQGSTSETTICPLLGVDLRYDLSPKWQLLARATVSGDGDSNAQWDLYGGVGYQFCDWCVGTIGYRYLAEDFERSKFTGEMDAHGAQVGLTFTF